MFDTSTVAGYSYFVDNIVAMDLSAIAADSIHIISNQTLKISVSDRYDTTAVKSPLNYYITSVDDIDFSSPKSPKKVGMHYYVRDFSSDGSYPFISNELFLQFDQKLKIGKKYSLTVLDIKDRANNSFKATKTFDFTYDDKTNINHSVKVNQVGYLPEGPKLAYIGNYLGSIGAMECSPLSYEIRNASNGQLRYSGVPKFKSYDLALSGEKVYECDFSNFKSPGKYYIYVPEIGRSYPFKIDTMVFDSVFYTTARALYYQRCGIALETPYADPRFVHGACHLSDGIIHTTCAASNLYNNEPIGGKVKMPGGWHDAGDYGRYIHFASTVLFDIFSMYEMFPEKFYDDELNLPESGNEVPDILDEAKWEIDWYKEMQAPDGGVYFKVNTTDWPNTMPEYDYDELYLAQKTTFSTGMYAAVLAMAYRSFKPYFPAYADTCIKRAKRAMKFLVDHPAEDPIGSLAVNPEGIGGGEGGDGDGDSDERAWAAAELYKSTGDQYYHDLFAIYWAKNPAYWGWNTFQHHQKNASWTYMTTKFPTDPAKITSYLQGFAIDVDANLIPQNNGNAYQTATRTDVVGWIGWGTFAQSSRFSYDFIRAYFAFGDKKYLDYAKINLNTQLGANPQNMTYITGVGSKYPMDPLHHPSMEDGVFDPVPGLSIYGPNSHLSFANGYDAITQGKDNLYPLGEQETDVYPIFRRYYDNHENVAMSEFDIDNLGYTAMVFGFFKSMREPQVVTSTLNYPKETSFEAGGLSNYPNPFTNKTTIFYSLNTSENVKLQIFDSNQKLVATILNQIEPIGRNSVIYDSSHLSPGLYFCKLSSNSSTEVLKMVKY